ncbi:MAG: hypothetical protein M3155_03685 [Actinomycetota bacterium]|nr:hypothetical protein [Actinomycetota bacterium]
MAVAAPPSTLLDVHGLRVRVQGDWREVIEGLRLDFAWFQRAGAHDGPVDVEVEVRRTAPRFDAFGDLRASFVTPRNVVYQQGDRKIVEYFGRALSTLDPTTGRLVVEGEDRELVHEAAYHFLISRIGEHIDAIGLTRLHGLGLSGAGGAVVLMLPSGGGKSTLVMRALRDERVRLLSEDTPLLDRHGRLYPFPLRIGINATDADQLPDGAVRRIERMEFHPKLALELEAFAHRIEPSPQPLRHLVIGRRSLGRDAHLEPVGRRAAVGPLLREAVVGVGVYQGMEFILQRGLRDVVGKLDVAARRSASCGRALARVRVWRLTLGRDRERNWAALRSLLS